MKNSKAKMAGLALSALMAAYPATAQEFGNAPTKTPQPEWVKNAVIYEVNLRQGSTERNLEGFAKELPRLKKLGVDILWLMPIHPISELNRKGELGSYYAVADYKAVNPEFGTIDDLKNFVGQAHNLGMKVILDEVCNHTGCDNAWVTEHPDYYAKDKDGKMYGPFDWTDTYKLDYSNPEMRKAMKDALKFWITETDIDGYRCDVAMEVPTDFWEDTRKELQTIKPIFMLAEASKPELTVSAFDADYNWPMKDVFNAIAATFGANSYAKSHDMKLPRLDATAIDSLLSLQKKQYPVGAINMNMITNHDLNSWEGTEFERLGPAVYTFALLSYTLPGMPMLYTGQEVGNKTAFEFFKYDKVPDYTANEYTGFYTMLNSLKHSQPALDAGINGGSMLRYPTEDTDVYVFSRQKGDSEVLVIANLSNRKADVKFTGETPSVDGKINWIKETEAEMPSSLDAWECRLFVRK